MMKEYAKVIDKLVKEVATFKRKNNIRGIVKIFNDEATLLNKNIEVLKKCIERKLRYNELDYTRFNNIEEAEYNFNNEVLLSVKERLNFEQRVLEKEYIF